MELTKGLQSVWLLRLPAHVTLNPCCRGCLQDHLGPESETWGAFRRKSFIPQLADAKFAAFSRAGIVDKPIAMLQAPFQAACHIISRRLRIDALMTKQLVQTMVTGKVMIIHAVPMSC